MKVGLIGDTHDRVPAVEQFAERFAAAGASFVLHAGDYCAPFSLAPFRAGALPLLGVFGRNDGDRDGLRAAASTLPSGGELFESPHSLELGGRSVLLVHDLGDALARSVEGHAIVVHGCSHRAEVRQRGGTLLVNPGEACGWLTGSCTAAVLDLDTLSVERVTLDLPRGA
ncbi:phosphodiesterase [Gemmatimonadetes bacterium T265]|nr:phosphodiesterase [Gemmatimonadetes bacterium T265]